MKLMYFLQEMKDVSLGYDFRLFHYGPYDEDVLDDLARARSGKLLDEEIIIYPSGFGYSIKPGPSFPDSETGFDEEVDFAIGQVIDEFGNLSAGELELRSTIHFVAKEFAERRPGRTDEDIASSVRDIKQKFNTETIRDRVAKMRAMGQLPTAPGL
jgi:hypothetical protein